MIGRMSCRVGPWLFDFENKTATHGQGMVVSFQAERPEYRFTSWEASIAEGGHKVEPAILERFVDVLTTLWTFAFMVTAAGTEYSREAPLTFLGRCGFKYLDVANALPPASDGWNYIVTLVRFDDEGESAPAVATLAGSVEDTNDLSASRIVALVRQMSPAQRRRHCVYIKLEPDPVTRAVLVCHLSAGAQKGGVKP